MKVNFLTRMSIFFTEAFNKIVGLPKAIYKFVLSFFCCFKSYGALNELENKDIIKEKNFSNSSNSVSSKKIEKVISNKSKEIKSNECNIEKFTKPYKNLIDRLSFNDNENKEFENYIVNTICEPDKNENDKFFFEDSKVWFGAVEIDTYKKFLSYNYDYLYIPKITNNLIASSAYIFDEVNKNINQDIEDCKKQNKRFIHYTANRGKYNTSTDKIGGSHWTSIMIDTQNKKIIHFNSMGTSSIEKKDLQDLKKVLNSEYKIEFLIDTGKGVQYDGYQCGPWTCFALEQILISPDKYTSKDWGIENMGEYRVKIGSGIAIGSILTTRALKNRVKKN